MQRAKRIGHESLWLSCALDCARLLARLDHRDEADGLLVRAELVAREQRNARRLFMVRLEQAKGWMASGAPLRAATALLEAKRIFERLQQGAERVWYQPGFGAMLAPVQARLRPQLLDLPEAQQLPLRGELV